MAASAAAGVLRGETVTQSSDELASCLRAARDVAAELQGYLVVLDAPAATRAKVDVWGPAPDGLDLMRQLKETFDPRGVLNPGRFVEGL